jgi:hypothetical protein
MATQMKGKDASCPGFAIEKCEVSLGSVMKYTKMTNDLIAISHI